MQASGNGHFFSSPSVAAHAGRIVALTAAAWRVPSASAREVGRRMPPGDVPMRARRRLRPSSPWPGVSLLAHSW